MMSHPPPQRGTGRGSPRAEYAPIAAPPSRYAELLAAARANLKKRPSTAIPLPAPASLALATLPLSTSTASEVAPLPRIQVSSPARKRKPSLAAVSPRAAKKSKSIRIDSIPKPISEAPTLSPSSTKLAKKHEDADRNSRYPISKRQLFLDVHRSEYLAASKDASEEARKQSAELTIRRIAPFRADLRLQNEIITKGKFERQPTLPIVLKYPNPRLRLWTAEQREQLRQAECTRKDLDDRLSQLPAENKAAIVKVAWGPEKGKYYFGVNRPRPTSVPEITEPLLRKRSPTTFSARKGKQKVPGLRDGTICVSELLEESDMPALSMPTSARADFDRRSQILTTPDIPAERIKAKKGAVKFMKCIDRVNFGELVFKAGYWSGYPEETIGKGGRSGTELTVKTLHVCKKCFAYSAVIADYTKHCRLCRRGVPGFRVYEHGAWSVWEVDGEVENLFCQKLSLFGKLFLEKKSVYYDVHAFNYFLLVHTNSTGETSIVGFFSKEKMSWDCNNLACIIVFPPWQRRGLGQILMGVSYEISRREEVMGGPEKPISEKGAAGYKRFWGREIARWLLEAKVTNERNGKGTVSVEEISTATWIQAEDCLMILKDMNVVVEEKSGEEAELGDEMITKVKIDKELVRKWVADQRLDLKKVVDPNGFLVDYGYPKDLSMDE